MKLWNCERIQTPDSKSNYSTIYNHPNRKGFWARWVMRNMCCLLKVHWSKQCISIGIEVQQKAVGSCEKPWGPTTVAGFGWISLCLTSWGIPRYAFSSASGEWNFAGLWKRSSVGCSTSLCMDQRCKKLGVFSISVVEEPCEHASVMSTAQIKSIQMFRLTFWITPCSLKHPTLLFRSQESLVALRPKKC